MNLNNYYILQDPYTKNKMFFMHATTVENGVVYYDWYYVIPSKTLVIQTSRTMNHWHFITPTKTEISQYMREIKNFRLRRK